ncbi:acetyl-CoA carboxylase biotin carboxyl carrier protein [Bacillus massiliglaciei]|uniref:acetyl-CoA carboxylase biotin carboxyl carrier protein n=1 Tax=Bacillus massiliglaciei TaxID=1816693 RepID=UPI000A99CEEB|nr:acetyl-CoA carboxylase biotin carboxyl carrier protein [Bacillus massiliglaciei]
MKVQEIREIIKLIDQSNITEFVFEQDGSKITMKKAEANVVQYTAAPQPAEMIAAPAAVSAAPAPAAKPAEAPAAETEKQADNLHTINSPMVGTFYESSSPEASAYVKVGDKVSADSIVCIVEAMKLFNEIEAEVNGEIVEVLVKDGQLVEYGQPLFKVKPE